MSDLAPQVQKEPLPTPLATCQPPSAAPLSEGEKAKYEWLLARVHSWTTVTCKTKPKLSGPLTDDERLWLTRECLIRYLRATKWHERESENRLLETLVWRREYEVDALTPELISPENETGKQLIVGYDSASRPCHYLNPALQNTEPSPRQVQHLVFMVERVLDLMPPRQQTLTLLVDFKPSKKRKNTAPGIGIGKQCLSILQTHYPERLGRALIINVPWVVQAFFKVITPFIDPLTREKIHFNEDMTKFVPKEQLWSEYPGGQLKFEYDHAVYWPSLWKLSQQRRASRKSRWQAGGKHIGEFEDYLSGATDVGLGGSITPGSLKVASTAPVPESTDIKQLNHDTSMAAANSNSSAPSHAPAGAAIVNPAGSTPATESDPTVQ